MRHAVVTMEDDLGTIVLSNPPQNRLSQQFFQEMRDGMFELLDRGARVAVLSADGPDFSYGGDIVPWRMLEPHQLRAAFEWERLPIPTVAVVQGLCLGGGFELAI